MQQRTDDEHISAALDRYAAACVLCLLLLFMLFDHALQVELRPKNDWTVQLMGGTDAGDGSNGLCVCEVSYR